MTTFGLKGLRFRDTCRTVTPKTPILEGGGEGGREGKEAAVIDKSVHF